MTGIVDDDVCQDGGEIHNRGINTFAEVKINSEGNGTIGGATRSYKVEEGERLSMNTIKLMMERARNPKMISKTIKKKRKGAKSGMKKGKLVGALLASSSQQGIRKFLLGPKTVFNEMEIDQGEVDSLGNAKNYNQTSCKNI